MESQCAKVRLRPGSVERVHEWAEELNRRSNEVLEIMRGEGVVVEAAFLDRTPDGDFLIYYSKARSLQTAREVARQSRRPIEEYHALFKTDVYESVQQLEPQIDFDNLSGLSEEAE